MKLAKTICCFLSLITVCHPKTYSQPFLNEERARLIKLYLSRVGSFDYSGQVLIAENNNIALDEAYGYANREEKIKATDETIFELASCSKMFTAIAILHLEMEGKLSVNDNLEKFFSHCPADKAGITIHQLLTHTSGIPGGDLVDDFAAISKEKLCEKIFATPLSANPGASFIYSNAGYNLLAAIIEKQSGKDYGAYLKQNIFIPLGMKHSFIAGDAALKEKKVAVAYNGIANNGGPDFKFNPRTWGGGSVCSTAGDLWLLKNGLYDNTIFNETARKKMMTKYVMVGRKGDNFYGYGCFVYQSPDDKSRVVDFIGENERGPNCTFRIFPDLDQTFISLSNCRHVGETLNSWNRWFLDPHLKNLWKGDKHFAIPPQVNEVVTRSLSKYAGTYQNGNSIIHLSVQGNNLAAEGEGVEASSLLYGMSTNMIEKTGKVEQAVSHFINSYINTNSEGFKMVMSAEQLKGFEEERDGLVKKYGQFKSYTIKGIFPDRDTSFLKCAIELEFEKGKVPFFTLWNMQVPAKPMIDFSSPGDKTTIAKIFAPLDKNTFIGYNFFTDAIDGTLNFKWKDGKVDSIIGGNNRIFKHK